MGRQKSRATIRVPGSARRRSERAMSPVPLQTSSHIEPPPRAAARAARRRQETSRPRVKAWFTRS